VLGVRTCRIELGEQRVAAHRVFVVRDGEHFGKAWLFRCERMDFQLAEAAAECKVLLGGDVLVEEEEHFPVEERLADDADRRIAERQALSSPKTHQV
tara:strand:- start:450 stop:740 length:291 start_codon:yes stop_codon:yes gene_type:complete